MKRATAGWFFLFYQAYVMARPRVCVMARKYAAFFRKV
jgi:hypothetical protein